MGELGPRSGPPGYFPVFFSLLSGGKTLEWRCDYKQGVMELLVSPLLEAVLPQNHHGPTIPTTIPTCPMDLGMAQTLGSLHVLYVCFFNSV